VAFSAYNIDGSYYFKLRDLAKALTGQPNQFQVGYDSANNASHSQAGKSYTAWAGQLTVSGSADASPPRFQFRDLS
jgi:hypothetical protein